MEQPLEFDKLTLLRLDSTASKQKALSRTWSSDSPGRPLNWNSEICRNAFFNMQNKTCSSLEFSTPMLCPTKLRSDLKTDSDEDDYFEYSTSDDELEICRDLQGASCDVGFVCRDNEDVDNGDVDVDVDDMKMPCSKRNMKPTARNEAKLVFDSDDTTHSVIAGSCDTCTPHDKRLRRSFRGFMKTVSGHLHIHHSDSCK